MPALVERRCSDFVDDDARDRPAEVRWGMVRRKTAAMGMEGEIAECVRFSFEVSRCQDRYGIASAGVS